MERDLRANLKKPVIEYVIESQKEEEIAAQFKIINHNDLVTIVRINSENINNEISQ